MIPVAAPLILGGLQAGLGFLSGKAKAKQAAANAELAAKLARIDTEYAPYGVAQKGYQVQPNTSTDSAAGGAISGAFTGGMQGLNVYRGLQGDKLNEDKLALLQKLSGTQSPLTMDMSGSGSQSMANVYKGPNQMVDLSFLGL